MIDPAAQGVMAGFQVPTGRGAISFYQGFASGV
jgi:hypothetical protein